MIKLSRSKIELLFECPRCFWFYAGKGITRPSDSSVECAYCKYTKDAS